MDEELIKNDIKEELRKMNYRLSYHLITSLLVPFLQGLIAILVVLFAHYLSTCRGPNCIKD